MTLAELQTQLARALTGHGISENLNAADLTLAAELLVAKRRLEAASWLPRTSRILGSEFARRFARFIKNHRPSGTFIRARTPSTLPARSQQIVVYHDARVMSPLMKKLKHARVLLVRCSSPNVCRPMEHNAMIILREFICGGAGADVRTFTTCVFRGQDNYQNAVVVRTDTHLIPAHESGRRRRHHLPLNGWWILMRVSGDRHHQ